MDLASLLDKSDLNTILGATLIAWPQARAKERMLQRCPNGSRREHC